MPNWVKIGSVAPEMKQKMFKSLRTTTEKTQIAISILSESDDLNNNNKACVVWLYF